MLQFNGRGAQFATTHEREDAVRLYFSISTDGFKPIEVKCTIKSRNTLKCRIVPASIVGRRADDKMSYLAQVEVDITKDVVEYFLADQNDFESMQEDTYDVSFQYGMDDITLTGCQPPILNAKADHIVFEDEFWLKLDANYDVLLRPYMTLHGNLSFYFDPTPLDTADYYRRRTKKIAAPSDKKIILCYEYPEKAQDNGMIFFKYLVNQYKEKYDVYYVVSRTSPDLRNLDGYEAHVVYYKSMQSLQLIEQANVLCHTHSPHYCLPFITGRTEALIQSKNRIFLQHGVIGSKDVSAIYGKQVDHSFTDLFVVSSERERAMVEKIYGYNNDEIALTGIARFDSLIRERSRCIKRFFNRKKVLIMPTWRAELWAYTEDNFVETDYYEEFQALLQHETLQEMHRLRNYTFSFYLHRNFQKFTHLFKSNFVEILVQGQHNVQDLLMDHGILVTDYSSIGFDFALMHKKVVYYRPPLILGKDIVDETDGFLPGPVITDCEELVGELSDTRMEAKYKSGLNEIYAFKDRHACDRIHAVMSEKFHLY